MRMASLKGKDSSPRKGKRVRTCSIGARASRFCASSIISTRIRSSPMSCSMRSCSSWRCSGERLSRMPCMAAICICICSIRSSSEFTPGKYSPCFCIKESKSGSLPSWRSRSILLRSRIISRILAMSSGVMFCNDCCIPWKNCCIICCCRLSISSLNFSRASSSMKSYSERLLIWPGMSCGSLSR